jgi:signal peptidase II
VSRPTLLLRALYLSISAAIVLLDQFTKAIVIERIPLYHSVPVVTGFFEINHVRNSGAAFGILASLDSPWRTLFLNVVALGVFAAVLVWALRSPADAGRLQAGLALILGGAVGNLVDRFRSGAVTDFLLFHIGRYEWPSFNVADSAITVGVFLLAWVLWTEAPAGETPASS